MSVAFHPGGPAGASLLLRALRSPAAVPNWPAADAALLLRQARRHALLGRLAMRVTAAAQAADRPLPAGLAAHFEAAARLWRAQRCEVEREAHFIRAALQALPGPVVVLKGAAYVLAELPAAQGRLFSDIDLMVPLAQLDAAESALMLHGWMGGAGNDYDERYYRQWMHELPPMTHLHRGTTLDLHHTILPRTARLQPDAQALFEAAQPLPGWPGLHTLCPADMVLHGITHLYMNEDMRRALRDLCDLDALLRHHAADAGFWTSLLQRAQRHQLARLLGYALRHARLLLDSPVPVEVEQALQAAAAPAPLAALLDQLWLRVFDPAGQHPLASAALYLRGHWLRMPAPMLLRHLTIKALRLQERQRPANQTIG